MPQDYPEIEPVPDPPVHDLRTGTGEDDVSLRWSPADSTTDGEER